MDNNLNSEINDGWHPRPPLSNERLLEIRNCCGAYLLSKAEKESLVDEVIASRQITSASAQNTIEVKNGQ